MGKGMVGMGRGAVIRWYISTLVCGSSTTEHRGGTPMWWGRWMLGVGRNGDVLRRGWPTWKSARSWYSRTVRTASGEIDGSTRTLHARYPRTPSPWERRLYPRHRTVYLGDQLPFQRPSVTNRRGHVFTNTTSPSRQTTPTAPLARPCPVCPTKSIWTSWTSLTRPLISLVCVSLTPRMTAYHPFAGLSGKCSQMKVPLG
mmetsp:Transcript_17290/g.48618  ORF Transcript_17290/g.48618 Transcript_17290/m.48618 type:complete len:200 (+) Transcript_17290:508-1107(+)